MRMEDLNIDIYADGADIYGMLEMYKKDFIKGFTTNPSLLKKAGVRKYTDFVETVLDVIIDLPVSFEVFADDFNIMEKEAKVLAQYGRNVYVKIPVMNSRGESSVPLIRRLSESEINMNITAVFTVKQAESVLNALKSGTDNIISVFAGRIADTGIDPETIMREVARMCRESGKAKSLWASSREVYNVMQAERCGADIITMTNDLLAKLEYIGKDLEQYSLETVQMFESDGRSLGFSIL